MNVNYADGFHHRLTLPRGRSWESAGGSWVLDTPTVFTVGLAWTPTPTVKPSAYIATWQKLCFRQCVLGAIYADGKTVGLAFEQKKNKQ